MEQSKVSNRLSECDTKFQMFVLLIWSYLHFFKSTFLYNRRLGAGCLSSVNTIRCQSPVIIVVISDYFVASLGYELVH